jgi:hypothetical protein
MIGLMRVSATAYFHYDPGAAGVRIQALGGPGEGFYFWYGLA